MLHKFINFLLRTPALFFSWHLERQASMCCLFAYALLQDILQDCLNMF
jgi:hypothetical protein